MKGSLLGTTGRVVNNDAGTDCLNLHTRSACGEFQDAEGEQMTTRLRLAVTADLHWGHRKGSEATQELTAALRAHPPDVFVLAGDIGTAAHFEECLALFADIDCRKVLVPGNHDLWVSAEQTAFDSLDLYERLLPEVSARHGFHYLDQGPLLVPEADTALVGSINWYDYSWALDGIRRYYPGDEHRLQ